MESDIIPAYLMVVLSFPVGWFATLAAGWLMLALDRFSAFSASLPFWIIWALVFVLGYLQWFVFFPYAFRKGRSLLNRQRP
jgi:hypothetical protein